jgi:hypothetical protein
MNKTSQKIYFVQCLEDFSPWNELPFFGCCSTCFHFDIHYSYSSKCTSIYLIDIADTLLMRSLLTWLKNTNSCAQLLSGIYDFDSLTTTKICRYSIHTLQYRLNLLSIEKYIHAAV